ncbi:MAG: PKD domain-containing protein, partial [candidate division WOR-3 bacterium]
MSNIRRSMRFASLLSILLCPSCKKNHPPDAPVAPAGPASGRVDIFYQFMTATTDPDGDDICYRFSWGDGGTSDWSPFIASGDTAAASHLWAAPGRYQVKTQAMDRQGATSGWSAAHGLVLVANSPPDRPPQPSGPDECSACVAYEFACCATDPDGDRVAIRIDWGDGDTSGW